MIGDINVRFFVDKSRTNGIFRCFKDLEKIRKYNIILDVCDTY